MPHLSEWLKFKRLIIPKAGKEVNLLQLSYTVGVNVKWYSHSRKEFGNFLKVKHTFTIFSNQSAHRYLPQREKKGYVHTETCTQMFTAASFIIAKNQKQPKCPSTSEWRGFPGGTVVKNLPANAGDMGSSPGLGRSHMPQSGQAREPQLLSLRIWSLCSTMGEATTVRGPCTAMKSGPCSLELEKALTQK